MLRLHPLSWPHHPPIGEVSQLLITAESLGGLNQKGTSRGRANGKSDGRAFLKWTACFRCGFAGTFTDFLDNGIVSTIADSSTARNAKQKFSKRCLSEREPGTTPVPTTSGMQCRTLLGILVILRACEGFLIADPTEHLLGRVANGQKVAVGE